MAKRMGNKPPEKWMQKADKSMERRGTKGDFKEEAQKRGMGVQELANKVMRNTEAYPSALVKQANFAKNAAKISKDNKRSSASHKSRTEARRNKRSART